jgi:hypothetical protein
VSGLLLWLRHVGLTRWYRETNRQDEIKELTSKGIIPADYDLQKHPEKSLEARSWLMGRVASMIHDVLPAKVIIDNMVEDASKLLLHGASLVDTKSKL